MTADITPYLQQLRELIPDGSQYDPLRLLVLEECMGWDEDMGDCMGPGGGCITSKMWHYCPQDISCPTCGGTSYVLRSVWQGLREQGIVGALGGAIDEGVVRTGNRKLQAAFMQAYMGRERGVFDPDRHKAQALIEVLKGGEDA